MGRSQKKARVEDALHATRAVFAEAVGANIVRRALEAPIRQIAADTYVDLVKAGVIDPAPPPHCINSVATPLFTTEALVSVVPENKKGGGGEDMGDMGY